MARPIDADELRHRYENIADPLEWFSHGQTTWMEAALIFVDMIDEAPTLDVQPVRRGEWKLKKGDPEVHNHTALFECSECGFFTARCTSFCPNCGADMRGMSE